MESSYYPYFVFSILSNPFNTNTLTCFRCRFCVRYVFMLFLLFYFCITLRWTCRQCHVYKKMNNIILVYIVNIIVYKYKSSTSIFISSFRYVLICCSIWWAARTSKYLPLWSHTVIISVHKIIIFFYYSILLQRFSSLQEKVILWLATMDILFSTRKTREECLSRRDGFVPLISPNNAKLPSAQWMTSSLQSRIFTTTIEILFLQPNPKLSLTIL